jgi:hypothetical protein
MWSGRLGSGRAGIRRDGNRRISSRPVAAHDATLRTPSSQVGGGGAYL